MSRIIGYTVGMGLPKPNLMQTDPSKGDYVHGKEEFAKKFAGASLESVCHVSYNLVNAVSNNYISTVNKGDDFEVTLTALHGYAFKAFMIYHNGVLDVNEVYDKPCTICGWEIYAGAFQDSGVQGDIVVIAVAELVGNATEQWVAEGYQPKGNYLTSIPDEYVTEDKLIIKVDKTYLVSVFEELKAALENTDIEGAVAVLDEAILDLSTLA